LLFNLKSDVSTNNSTAKKINQLEQELNSLNKNIEHLKFPLMEKIFNAKIHTSTLYDNLQAINGKKFQNFVNGLNEYILNIAANTNNSIIFLETNNQNYLIPNDL
jgi:TolA-binding protein